MIRNIVRKIVGKKIYSPLTLTREFSGLSNKTVIVTGGGSGIGAAIAETIVRSGGVAVIIGRDAEKLKNCEKKLGEHCISYILDLNQVDENSMVFYDIERKSGRKIDGLVNNAGVYIDKGLLGFSRDDFDIVINTNLRAPIFLIMRYVEYCKKNNMHGNIVVTASNRGLFGDYGPYGVSKRGIIHYVQGIARELIGTGIRVNAVAPGMTASDINGCDPGGDLYTASARGERVMRPEEIAEVVCFLLSDRSKCINGAIIPCDEGDYLR